MKSNHISIALALKTCINCIIAGEEPVKAIRTCFRMRYLTNILYDLGITQEEMADVLNQDKSSL